MRCSLDFQMVIWCYMSVFREVVPIPFHRLLGQEHLAREIGGIFRWTGLGFLPETANQWRAVSKGFLVGKFNWFNWRDWILGTHGFEQNTLSSKKYAEILWKSMIRFKLLMVPQPPARFCNGSIAPIKNLYNHTHGDGGVSIIALWRSNCLSNLQ